MQWFKHSSDARNSLKLRKVRRKYGADGYAIYWFCLEAIAYEVDKDNLTFDLKEDAETIAFELSIQEKRVEEIMHYLVETGLFESSQGVITCLKLAERLDKSMTNSPKMRAWLDSKSVMTCADDVMTCAELDKNRLDQNRLDQNRLDNKPVKSNKPDRAPSIDYEAVKTVWNETMVNSPKVSKLNEKRKRLVKRLFNDNSLTIEKFRNYLLYVTNTESWKWCFEVSTGANGVKYGARPFEYFLKEDTFLRAKEEI